MTSFLDGITSFRIGLCSSLAAVLLLALGAEARSQSSSGTAAGQKSAQPWLDRNADIEDRVAALLEDMTLTEKIGQMCQTNGIGGDVTGNPENLQARDALIELVRGGKLGSILNDVDTENINYFQKLAVEESRLGVPLIFGRDVIHGFRTIFPLPIGQAASWNPDLVAQAAEAAAAEARSVGIHWTFSPMVDIARDPRWGRIAEGFGEDPHLASALSAAMVRGYQGDDLAAPNRIAACAKHFAGYGAGEGGRDYNSAQISPSLMRNVYLPPFHAAVNEGVATLMTSFNEVNGIPGSANTHLLRNVLREDWKFRGFVVSDWDSIEEMIAHGYSADERDAARAAALAGVNMEMVSQTYHGYLAGLVEDGAVPESVVDDLVAGILRVKFQLGLFENPYTNPSTSSLLTEDHLKLARQLARQSIVLLKNANQALPLERPKLKALAVIGPLADARKAQLGTWIPDGREEDSRTALAAIRESAGDGVKVIYAAGLADDLDRSHDGFDEAVAAARAADVVVLMVGERAEISGEASSRAIIDLPGAQVQLVEAIVAVGKPLILVVQAGRPLTIGRQLEKADAVLYSFHAGTMAGPAIADLLWGVESPSGKLPVTFPKSVGQIPLYYNHPNTGRPPRPYDFAQDQRIEDRIKNDLGFNSNYIDVTPYPLFPFGYGLSYAEFEYGDVELSTGRIRAGETLAIRAPVTNTGKMAADEIVQLYVHDVVGSLVRPVRELKGFRRVRLEPGETQVIEFALPADDLAYYDNEEKRVLEPGAFEVYVGGSSLAPLAGKFDVVE